MANQWPNSAYTDQTKDPSGTISATVANPCGIPLFSTGNIPLTTVKNVFTEEWMAPADFAAVALNTAHPSAGMTPDYSAYLLVSEGPRQDVGGALVKWTRTYAKIPASYSLFERFPYSYIGYLQEVATTPAILISRPREIWVYDSRIQHDYFIVGGGATFTDPITSTVYTGGVTSPGDVDRIEGMVYCFQNTISGALYGGINLSTDVLNPAGSPDPTWPTSDDYNGVALVDALTNKWAATVSIVRLFPTNTLAGGPPATSGHMAGAIDLTSTPHSVLGGQLPAEPSWIDNWMGNIWVRRTRYVLAR